MQEQKTEGYQPVPPMTPGGAAAQKINPELIETNPRFKSDYGRANVLERLFFTYGIKLYFKGLLEKRKTGKNYFNEEDTLTIPWTERPDVLSDRFSHHLEDQKKSKRKGLNLSLAMLKAIKWPLLSVTTVQTAFIFVRIFSTWVLKKLIDAFLVGDSNESYKWAGVLTACLVVGFLTEHNWNFTLHYYPVYVQNALIDIIYGKVQKLSSAALTQISTGRIISLATNGLNFLDNYGQFLPSCFSGFAALIAGGAVIWQSFGVYTLIALGYFVAWIPLQGISIFASAKQRTEQNNLTSQRVKTTSETIEGIRLLKMYTWEMKFKEKIEALRNKELEYLKGATIGSSISRACAFSTQDCGSFLMFLAYYYTDHTLEVGAVFACYFTLGYLRVYSSYFICAAILFLEEASNVFGAIEKILEAPEMGDVKFEQPKNAENSVEYENFTAYWEDSDYQLHNEGKKKEIQPTLQNINLNIKEGSVNALVGIVGSGKTSFLMSFTGEMPKTTGKLRYKGNIAYVEQEPTIFAGTFRENVLFGKPYDEERYQKAVSACNLTNDLKLFAKGDNAEIVGGGMNLSGGQKARLAFARAVYSDADIYLLDDPLSAVDPKVAKSLYKNAIEGALKGKTIILVTHQVDYVKNCENIIVIEKGKVLGSGTLEELKSKGVHPENIFGDDHQKDSSELENSRHMSINEPELKGGITSTKDIGLTIHHHETKNTNRMDTVSSGHHIIETSGKSSFDWNNEAEDRAIISGENMTNKATLETYIDLFKKMGGWPIVIAIVLAVTASQMTVVAYGRMLGAWLAGTFPAWKCCAILGGLVGFDIFIINVIFLLFGLSTQRASKEYHKTMLDKVINAKTLFFDTNPVGEIINRFSIDTGVMDRFIPLGLTDVINIFGVLVMIVITVGIMYPLLLAPVLPALAFGFSTVAVGYASVEQSKMYELKAKGPAYSLLSETLNGLVIIRMFKQEASFKRRFRDHLHRSTKGSFAFALSSRVGGFYADMAYLLACIGSIFILTAKNTPELSTAFLSAFSLALLLGITGLLQYFLRQFSTLNISMASAARVQEYCKIPSEPPQELEGDREKIQRGWPDQGKIDVNSVYMKYRPDMDFVLKDLNLEVKAGEKIGCVGRTGAGKSTIVQMLYRMREIDRKEKGSAASHVNFDDVNTQKVGLKLLRSKVSMIPQTPYIFSETVRTNIDPLGQYTDEQIWRVLEDVRLKEHIEKQSNGLDTKIHGGSSLFSVGQKQLVCLARVVLKPAPVLIMDEATANMDHETDNFLQEKIDQRFDKSTRFTIAHRLTTIANYDKVLVLSKGRKVEYDEPYKLLVNNIGDQEMTNKGGYFSIMVQNTGPISSKQIFEIAKNAYFEKHQGGAALTKGAH